MRDRNAVDALTNATGCDRRQATIRILALCDRIMALFLELREQTAPSVSPAMTTISPASAGRRSAGCRVRRAGCDALVQRREESVPALATLPTSVELSERFAQHCG